MHSSSGIGGPRESNNSQQKEVRPTETLSDPVGIFKRAASCSARPAPRKKAIVGLRLRVSPSTPVQIAAKAKPSRSFQMLDAWQYPVLLQCLGECRGLTIDSNASHIAAILEPLVQVQNNLVRL